MNGMKSLENRGILLKGATAKITSQEGGFLNFLRSLMTADLPLMKSVLTQFTKSVLIQLVLSGAGMSAADTAIQKKICGSGTTALIISDEEKEDILKSLEESGLLIKGISEMIKNEAKERKGGFISVLLETLAASILGNALARKVVIRAGEGVLRVGQNF